MKITKRETIARLRKLPLDEAFCKTMWETPWQSVPHCPLGELYQCENPAYYAGPEWRRNFIAWADGHVDSFARWRKLTPRQCLEALDVKP